MKRRTFLLALTSVGLNPLSLTQASSQPDRLRFLSVRADHQHRYAFCGLDGGGGRCFDLPLPGRAHGMAVHPDGDLAMVIARRPGTFLQPVDLRQGRLLKPLGCAPQRHLYGHALYSPDGHWLYTTENDYEAGRGVIVVRNARQDYRVVDEFHSGGIGPHELRLLSDGNTLVVANGGIRTHPDFDRTPLNLESMQPSLAYLDRHHGQLFRPGPG